MKQRKEKVPGRFACSVRKLARVLLAAALLALECHPTSVAISVQLNNALLVDRKAA
jgi:hypothetical protein